MQPRKDANARRIHPNCFPINPACPAASAAARGRARRLPMRLATALLALVAGPALAQFATPDAINVPMTIADASADEGDAITFTVTLDKAHARRDYGDSQLHRRHRHQWNGLHREHGGPRLPRHLRRDAEHHRFRRRKTCSRKATRRSRSAWPSRPVWPGTPTTWRPTPRPTGRIIDDDTATETIRDDDTATETIKNDDEVTAPGQNLGDAECGRVEDQRRFRGEDGYGDGQAQR